MSAASAASPRRWRWAGGAAGLVFAVLVLRFWHPVYGFTRFLQVDAANDATNLPAFREQPIYLYRNTGGYDGQYYAQIAYDPSIRTPALHTAVDNLEYRARRILPSVTAYLLAGGRPTLIAAVYALLNPLAWLVLAALLWSILPVTDGRSFAAWGGVMFSAGALAAVRYALTDLIAVTLTVAALGRLTAAAGRSATSLPPEALAKGGGHALTSAVVRDRTRSDVKRARSSRSTRSAIVLALAALSRETALLAVPALWTRPWFSRRNAAVTAVATMPILLWLVYLRWQLGPGDAGLSNFAWPFQGWAEKLSATVHAVGGREDPLLVASTLLAVIGVSVQAAYCLLRPQWDDPWGRVGLIYSALLLCLGTAVWEGFPGAAFRAVLPLTVACNLILVRRRAGWGWLAGANLGVAAGLLALLQVPDDPGEIGAAHPAHGRIVAQAVSGWYGAEHNGRHRWAWASGDAVVRLTAWPRSAATVRCSADLRSLSGQSVTISEGSRLCWSGEVSAGKTTASWVADLVEGQATLTFRGQARTLGTTRSTSESNSSTSALKLSASGTSHSSAPGDPRALAFALYDLKMTDLDVRTHTP